MEYLGDLSLPLETTNLWIREVLDSPHLSCRASQVAFLFDGSKAWAKKLRNTTEALPSERKDRMEGTGKCSTVTRLFAAMGD
jgi:hypothetical protein